MRKQLLVMGLIVFAGWMLVAGTGGRLRCTKCKYKSRILYLGGGQRSSCTTIYCHHCKVYRSLTTAVWRGSRRKVYKPLGSIQLIPSRETRRIFRCPGCKGIAIEVPNRLLYRTGQKPDSRPACPKCSSGKLRMELSLKWD